MRPRVLLADDHSLFLEGLSLLLAREFEIVGSVTDGRAMVEAARNLNPDLIVLDLGMPILNGVEAMRQVRGMIPAIKLVVVSQQSDRPYVQAAFRAGASGYVLKQSAAAELVGALKAVLAGQYYVAPQLAAGALGGQGEVAVNPSEMFGGSLTARQREVLQLIAEGKSAKEVAAILKISPKTVEFHKAAIVETLGIRTTAELTRYAMQTGIASSR